jgi:phosphoribosyl-ATP pyrophosphohydrolase
MYYEFNEKVASDAQAASTTDEGLRERISALVMNALVERRADPAAVRNVLRSALAGIDGGLAQRGVQAGDAVREAVKGMDDAVARSVYALRMALEEAWEQGREFADTDAKDAMSSIQDLEEDLLSTLKNAADDTRGWIQGELSDLAVHLKRTGTDTGIQVRDVAQRLNNRLTSAARGSGADAKAAVSMTRSRLNDVASGILRGLADALDARASRPDATPVNSKDQ